MREKIIYSLIFLIFLFLYSCAKDSDYEKKFIGSWEIITPDSDTLMFIDEYYFTRNDYKGLEHSFKYYLSEDNITINYSGPNLISVRPTKHHYELNENELTIDFTNGCYGFKSEKYVLNKIE